MSVPQVPNDSDILNFLKREIRGGRYGNFLQTLQSQPEALKQILLAKLLQERDKNGQTIFHILVSQIYPNAVPNVETVLAYLLQFPQTPPNGIYAQDKNGQTALHIAAKKVDVPLLTFLMRHDKDQVEKLITIQDNKGKTAFDLQDHLGRTIFHRLARKGETELLKFLLDKPVHNPDPPSGIYIQNNKLRTPLHIAAKTGHADIVNAIIAFDKKHNGQLVVTPDINAEIPLTLGLRRSTQTNVLVLNEPPKSPAAKALWEATPENQRPTFEMPKKVVSPKLDSKSAKAFIRARQLPNGEMQPFNKDNPPNTEAEKMEQMFASGEHLYHVLADKKDEYGKELQEGAKVEILSDIGEVLSYVCHPIIQEPGLTGFALTPASGIGEIKIVFRGTKDKPGAFRDLSPGGAGHYTFSRKKHAILEKINDIIGVEKMRLMTKEGVTKEEAEKLSVSVGGHSLGGADAQGVMTLLMEGMCVAKGGNVPEKFSAGHVNNLNAIQNIRLQVYNPAGVSQEIATRATEASKQLKQLDSSINIKAHYLRVRRDPVNVFGQHHILVHSKPEHVSVETLKFTDYHFFHAKAAHTQKHFNKTVKGRKTDYLNPKIYKIFSNSDKKGQHQLHAEFSGYIEPTHFKFYNKYKQSKHDKLLKPYTASVSVLSTKPVSNIPHVAPLMRIQNVNNALHKKNIHDVTFSLANDNRAQFSGNEKNLFNAVEACGDQELVQATYRLVVPLVNNDLEATKQKAREIIALNPKNGTKIDCIVIQGEKYDLNLEKMNVPPRSPTMTHITQMQPPKIEPSKVSPEPPSTPSSRPNSR